MEQKTLKQIHIIPFDLGCVFFDCLSLDNSKNLCFAEEFLQKLEKEGKKLKIIVTHNIHLKRLGKTITGVKYKDSSIAEQAIGIVQLLPNLKCYLLANGIGIFILTDFDGSGLKNVDPQLFQYDIALVAKYQKKTSQLILLNHFDDTITFAKEKSVMLLFRELCWKIVEYGVKKRKIRHVRKYSASKAYKAEGLSYVLTVYLIEKNQLTTNELNHLMLANIFKKVTDPKEWENIHQTILNVECKDNPISLKIGKRNTYYSWSAVAVETERAINSFEDIRNDEIISTVLKAEIYVQSRWFIADNSMDNVNKSSTYTMENLQRVASLIEFSEAELENEISANMDTTYKQILANVIVTSEVRELYKSAFNQINTQKKIKEAHELDKKRKNKLIVDLLLAVFSASSLYKTVNDLISNQFSLENLFLFLGMLVIAIGTILFNYKNR